MSENPHGSKHDVDLGGQEAVPGIVNGSGTSGIFGAEIPDVFTTSHAEDDGKGRHGEGEMTLGTMEKHHMMMMHRPHEQHGMHHQHHHHHHVMHQDHSEMGMIRMLGEEETAALAADLADFEKRTQVEPGPADASLHEASKKRIIDDGEEADEDGPSHPKKRSKKRGGYTWWWKEGVIENILEFVKEKNSYFKAVKELKVSEYNSDGRYNKLAPSTVESWFVKGSYTELKDKYKIHRERLEKSTRPGQTTTLGKYPPLEKAVYDLVKEEIEKSALELREFDGKGLQQRVLGLVQQERPELLKVNGGKLTLSMKFIKRFCMRYFPDNYPFIPKKKYTAYEADEGEATDSMNNGLPNDEE